jgi:hypothetical protein
LKKYLGALVLCLTLPATSYADLITFDFTGRLIVAAQDDSILENEGSTYTPIDATLTFDTASGIGGSSDLSIDMIDFFGAPATFHDITMQQSGANLITGQVLIDWNSNIDMPLHIEWEATGLFTAINYGLQPGDVLSGTDLYHDANGDGIQNANEPTILDINSATPYSSTLEDIYWGGLGINPDPQGPSPLAATSNSLGLQEGTPFDGIRGFFDIGSGDSMHVTSISSVPVPAAVWLFGSGLLGLVGMARRKKA